MRNRIFMDVQEVMGLADKFSDYRQTLTSTIEEYRHSVSKMLESMEGSSKDSLEKASCNIQKEIQDAAGRFEGFSYIYKTTANARIKIDREAKEAAQAWKFGRGIEKSNWSKSGNSNVISNYSYYPYNIQPQTIVEISIRFSLTIDEVVSILRGYIPKNISNDTVVKVLDFLAQYNKGMDKLGIIELHRVNNVQEIDKVYEKGYYIENQYEWNEVCYGNYEMSYNGCGIIAIVNAYLSMGVGLTSEQIADIIAMFEEEGCVSCGKWGTSPLAIVEYFENNTFYTVNYTTSTDSEDIARIAEESDTFIVEVYNYGDDISGGMHFVNIEKKVDANGNITYIVHNANEYEDTNANGYIDNGEYNEYSSLEDAIDAVSNKDNSKPIIIIGLTKPKIDDETKKED